MNKPVANDSPIVEAAADHVEPPPPEAVEPDADLSPEVAEQARKDYLLTRFWISARGFWGRGGDRLAWIFSIGLAILIVTNVGSNTASTFGIARSSMPSKGVIPPPCII